MPPVVVVTDVMAIFEFQLPGLWGVTILSANADKCRTVSDGFSSQALMSILFVAATNCGIFNDGGTVTLNGSSSITGNSAFISGGGISNFSGQGTLSDTSSITGNDPDNCTPHNYIVGCTGCKLRQAAEGA